MSVQLEHNEEEEKLTRALGYFSGCTKKGQIEKTAVSQ